MKKEVFIFIFYNNGIKVSENGHIVFTKKEVKDSDPVTEINTGKGGFGFESDKDINVEVTYLGHVHVIEKTIDIPKIFESNFLERLFSVKEEFGCLEGVFSNV